MCGDAPADTFVRHGKWCVGRGKYPVDPGPHPSVLLEKHEKVKSQVSNLQSDIKKIVMILKALLGLGLGMIASKIINKLRAK